MKKFLANLLVFAALASGLTILWSALLIHCEYGRYLKSCKMPDGTSVAVCCDSHTEVGLDPGRWPELHNVSRSGTRFRQYYLRAIDLCRENPGRIQAALIDVSILKYYLSQPEAEPNKRGEDQLATLELIHREASALPLSEALAEFFTAVWQGKSKRVLRGVFGGKYKSFLNGGFAPLETRAAITAPERFAAIARERADEINAAYSALGGRKPEVLPWLRKLVDLYQAQGAKVVLIRTPVHRLIQEATVEAGRAQWLALEDFTSRRGMAFLDFAALEIPDEEWADVNHVNWAGSRRLTEAVRDEVMKSVGREHR